VIMQAYDNRYSLFVNWSKIILPLIAIALLSTLFLFSKRPTDGDLIPFAEIEEIARENRLTNPNFSGVGANRIKFEVSAIAARPDAADARVITVDRTRIALESVAGDTVEIIAGSSRIDPAAKTLTTAALTRVSASSGYTMETEGLIATFDAGTVETTGPLEARAPYGRLSAGHMLIRGANDDGGLMIVFNQGVRLVYLPKEQD